MARMEMTVPHGLSQDEALRRIKGLLEQIKTQFADKIVDLSETWQDRGGRFSFKAMGYPVSGTLEVQPSQIKLHAEFPWQLSLFRGTIETRIREKTNSLLA